MNIVARKSTYVSMSRRVSVRSCFFFDSLENRMKKLINILSEIRNGVTEQAIFVPFQSLLISSITSTTKRFFVIQPRIVLRFTIPYYLLYSFEVFCYSSVFKTEKIREKIKFYGHSNLSNLFFSPSVRMSLNHLYTVIVLLRFFCDTNYTIKYPDWFAPF